MTKDTHPSDDALLGRMAAGDEEAFSLLYRRRHAAIYRFALQMSGSAATAEDVTQEVFMALIRGAGRFDPSRGTVNGFLFGIARNHLRKRWEQERRLTPLGANDAEEASALRGAVSLGEGSFAQVDEALMASETAARVQHAVATLPEGYREVVVLCELQEMSYDEAAAALRCPVGTVRSRLHRARAMLMEKLRGTNSLARGAAAVNE